jgi:hypothetical protein
MRALADELLANYRENPWAVGSRKQPVEHPRLREYVALSVRILALTETLLLSPRARAPAGMKEDPDPLAGFWDADDN